MRDLQHEIADILQSCLDEHGMRPPLILCAISPNGSICAWRCRGNFTAGELLAEHTEGRGFAVPMTITVIDQDNVATRIELGRDLMN